MEGVVRHSPNFRVYRLEVDDLLEKNNTANVLLTSIQCQGQTTLTLLAQNVSEVFKKYLNIYIIVDLDLSIYLVR